jgi:hypothetical protein
VLGTTQDDAPVVRAFLTNPNPAAGARCTCHQSDKRSHSLSSSRDAM